MAAVGELSLLDRLHLGGALSTEFTAAELGDARLDERLQLIAERFGRAPGNSIPSACEDWAETKAVYRFCDNETVDPTAVLASHLEAHRDRVADRDELLVVADTTHLTFPSHPAKEGLGDIGDSTIDVEGVKLHTAIGLDPTSQVMTGVLDQQVLVDDRPTDEKYVTNGRQAPIELASEGEKWLRGDRAVLEALPPDARPIFVHDRGADSFSYYQTMATEVPDAGYVIRANQNRSIRPPTGEESRLFDWSESLPELGRTTIELQQSGGRPSREAELSITAGSCKLLAPKNDPSMTGSVEVTVVRVDEIEPDPEEVDEPIQWVLLTTEPVGDFEDAMTVIEYYRCRWKIEDWHQVLKSGCRIEDRQLETWERMEVLLSIYSVVAWRVLELRELGRGSHGLPPGKFLSEAEQAVLEAKHPDLEGENGRAYAIAVATVGGYLDRGSDPPPGWETMWKGLQEVRVMAKGFELGRS